MWQIAFPTIKNLQFIELFLAVKHLHIDIDGVTWKTRQNHLQPHPKSCNMENKVYTTHTHTHTHECREICTHSIFILKARKMPMHTCTHSLPNKYLHIHNLKKQTVCHTKKQTHTLYTNIDVHTHEYLDPSHNLTYDSP